LENQKNVVMYGTPFCSYCGAAKMLLTKKKVDYEFILVSGEPGLRDEIERRTGKHTVPQIFINDESIGGFDELYALERNGGLDVLLAGE
jgi:glutaredoxin 3